MRGFLAAGGAAGACTVAACGTTGSGACAGAGGDRGACSGACDACGGICADGAGSILDADAKKEVGALAALSVIAITQACAVIWVFRATIVAV